MSACLTPGCQRVPRAGYARCEACHAAFLVPGATPAPSGPPEPPVTVSRVGVRPLPEMSELELRFAFGDR